MARDRKNSIKRSSNNLVDVVVDNSMEELIDAVVAEFKRSAEQFPLDTRVHIMYDYKKMVDRRVAAVMEKFKRKEKA